MDQVEAKQLLHSINQVRFPNKKYKSIFIPKKRKHESNREYCFRLAKHTCIYCEDQFPPTKLSYITLYHDNRYPKFKNKACACHLCARQKGSMNHDEYIKYRNKMKKQIRKEVLSNYRLLIEKIKRRYNYKCIYCQVEFGFTPKGRKLTIDHKFSVSKGVSKEDINDEKNLGCACEDHNFDKGNLSASEYFEKIRRRKRAG